MCDINSTMLQRLTKISPGYNNLRIPQLQEIFKNRHLYDDLANKDLEALAKIIQETFDNLQSYYFYLCENDMKGKNRVSGLFRLSIQREQKNWNVDFPFVLSVARASSQARKLCLHRL